MPIGGLTTTMDVAILSSDRFVRNWVAVTDASKPPEREIENLHVTTYASAAGETPATVLPKLIRTYPDVIVVRDVSDLETLSILCEQVGQNRLVLTSIRAKEAVEALLRCLMLKIPAEEFAPAVTAVLNTRLIRKLCETCKEGYAPPAEVLKQMGLPAGRVEALYRPPTAPIDPKHPDVVCEQCQGVGYFGRTAIFELLIVDDEIRNVLTTAPKLGRPARRGPQGQAPHAAGRRRAARGSRHYFAARTAARAQTIEERSDVSDHPAGPGLRRLLCGAIQQRSVVQHAHVDQRDHFGAVGHELFRAAGRLAGQASSVGDLRLGFRWRSG